MIIVEEIKPPVENASELERDVVTLTWEARRKSRQKVTTQKGMELGLAFPTGTVFQHGDILFKDESRYVIVEAALEDVLIIRPEAFMDAALIAYEIGNMHRAIAISEDMIATPFDHHVENKVRENGLAYGRKRMSFEPIKKSHSHG